MDEAVHASWPWYRGLTLMLEGYRGLAAGSRTAEGTADLRMGDGPQPGGRARLRRRAAGPRAAVKGPRQRVNGRPRPPAPSLVGALRARLHIAASSAQSGVAPARCRGTAPRAAEAEADARRRAGARDHAPLAEAGSGGRARAAQCAVRRGRRATGSVGIGCRALGLRTRAGSAHPRLGPRTRAWGRRAPPCAPRKAMRGASPARRRGAAPGPLLPPPPRPRACRGGGGGAPPCCRVPRLCTGTPSPCTPGVAPVPPGPPEAIRRQGRGRAPPGDARGREPPEPRTTASAHAPGRRRPCPRPCRGCALAAWVTPGSVPCLAAATWWM
jgi:hypothetical protein